MINIKPVKVLIADDDAEFLNVLSHHLKEANYTVFKAANGIDALSIAKKENPQLIILDINMPGMDGVEVCRHIKEFPELNNTIILFLTNCNEDYTQIAAFEAGADDYISKPLKPELHLSRIRAILKRIVVINKEPITVIGDITIDREKFLIFLKNKSIELPRKEFELLEFLTSRPGKVFSRDEILNSLWNKDFTVIHRTIDVHISKLREKIGDKYIKTIKGIGYKFEI
jgi:two-component system alkaline phosphatase synthesis response regulator PhoP